MSRIYLRIPRKEITLLTKIIESYDNIGVVSTVDSAGGMVMIHITPDTRGIVMEIIKELPFVEEIWEE